MQASETNSIDGNSNSPQSRFKYLFFEILTPDEYNDIIYLGDEILDSSLEEVAKEMESTRAFPTKKSFQEEKRHTGQSEERISAATQEKNNVIVDDGKRQKMESLLKRMSERCFFNFSRLIVSCDLSSSGIAVGHSTKQSLTPRRKRRQTS